MRNNIVIGIPFWKGAGVPLRNLVLRYLKYKIGDFIFDIIQDYDAEDLGAGLYDMNPYDLSDPDIELQIMDRSNLSIWSETDAAGDTIRDLPGYNPLNPFEWLGAELDVDIFDTYINSAYLNRLFANFAIMTTLAVYSRELNCQESWIVHNKLQTGGVWVLNRAEWNDCGRWKDDNYWRDS